MHWDNGWNGGGGWWWLLMVPMMILFWGGLIWLVVTLVRSSSSPGAPVPRAPEPPRMAPEDILHERFARGEIGVDEYKERLEALKTPRSR